MQPELKLTASQEDYLEAIYNISRSRLAARGKDIAGYLGVGPSSVTGALKALGEMKLINYAPYDFVTLTDYGRSVAEDIAGRHNTLEYFLIKVLGIEKKAASEAACIMEHNIPGPIVERLKKYSEYVDSSMKAGITWKSGFGYYCKNGCLKPDRKN
ncbi:MAG: DtxR family transcriptional regulator [Deltaproteobacteria bacterium]|nr:MAG: DtxR family transcriptional regulator [Deltaproteobacteria bacterium]